MLDAAAEGAACGDSGAGTPVALRSPATRLSFTPSGPRHDATTGGVGYSPSGGGTDTAARTDSEEELRRQLALANAEIDAQAEVVARLRAQLRNSGDGAPMNAVQEKQNFDIMVSLQGLYFCDAESISHFGSDAKYWETISDGLHCTSDVEDFSKRLEALRQIRFERNFVQR